MEEGIVVAILGIIFAVGLPVIGGSVILFNLVRGRSKERLAMIEKGIMPDSVERPERKSNRYTALRNGLFMIGISLGAILGILMGPVMVVNDWMDFTILIMAVLFGGIAFVIYFFLSRKMEEQERISEEKRLNL